jgi:hypothetical protein
MEQTMTVKYKIDGAVCLVTLAKPLHNLLDDALLEGLTTVYEKVAANGARRPSGRRTEPRHRESPDNGHPPTIDRERVGVDS